MRKKKNKVLADGRKKGKVSTTHMGEQITRTTSTDYIAEPPSEIA